MPLRLSTVNERGAAPLRYQRRWSEEPVLRQVVQYHLATFLEQARERSRYGTGLPRERRERVHDLPRLRNPRTGLCAGSVRDSGNELLVAFSSRRRGICPSCDARRIHDTAAHVVDRIFPLEVATRQRVFSLPFPVHLLLVPVKGIPNVRWS